MLSFTFVLALIRPFDIFHPISVWVFFAYPLPACTFATLPLVIGINWILRIFARFSVLEKLQPSVAVIIICVVSYFQFSINYRANDTIAYDYGNLLTKEVAPDTVLITDEDDFVFSISYAQRFVNQRKDITITPVEQYLTSIDYKRDINEDDVLLLTNEQRPVAFTTNPAIHNLGRINKGTHYLLDKENNANAEHFELSDDVRKWIHDMVALYEQGVRNPFLRIFIERELIDLALFAESMRVHGNTLSFQDKILVNDILLTAPGQYAKFVNGVLNPTQDFNIQEIERSASALSPYWNELELNRRADVLHLLASARIAAGNLSGAVVALQLGLAEYPSQHNYLIIIDLLQIYGTEGDYDSYLKLRQRYPVIKEHPSIAKFDAECAEVLEVECIPEPR